MYSFKPTTFPSIVPPIFPPPKKQTANGEYLNAAPHPKREKTPEKMRHLDINCTFEERNCLGYPQSQEKK